MERNFRAKHPHQLWVADITYVRTRAGSFTQRLSPMYSHA